MGIFLEEILEHKKLEVENCKKNKPLEELIAAIPKADTESLEFEKAITRSKGQELRLIAEIKKASPSRGNLREDFHPEEIGKIYETHGAQAISVLTDKKFFQGGLEDLKIVSQTVSLPTLRKDFIVDEYQIYEAKLYGAKAVLLIVSALKKSELNTLLKCIERLNLSPLVEIHDEKELEIALESKARIIGINNRDLKTFHVDLSTCEKLVQKIPSNQKVVIESGILSRNDVLRVAHLPIDAILVGEAFMTAKDIGAKVKELMGSDVEQV